MKDKILLATVLVGIALIAGMLWNLGTVKVEGSVTQGNDYFATSTKYFPGTSMTNLTVLKTVGGTLARVTITGANTGVVRLWNATTTNVNLRTGNKATSTLTYVELPTNLVAGVYDFDAVFDVGILYELVSGNAPTSTILMR